MATSRPSSSPTPFTAWVDSMKGVVADPLSAAFPTISNDQSSARSWPKGAGEGNARTIKPKVKDMDPNKRVRGIPGLNVFGAPSSKQGGGIFDIFD